MSQKKWDGKQKSEKVSGALKKHVATYWVNWQKVRNMMGIKRAP